MRYPADKYDFVVTSTEKDGVLPPPPGDGWFLISTNAAQEDGADGRLDAILIATWARRKTVMSPAD